MPRLSALVVLIVSMTLAAESANTADTANTRATQSRVTPSIGTPSAQADLEPNQAAEWGLKAEEWTRYRQLMRGPLGVYSPNIDPLTALGIEARTEEDRRRYAELQVRAEGRRTEKLLAYQRAYDEAWKRLFPTLQPLRTLTAEPRANASQPVASDSPQRLAVFIKESCPPCDERVRQLQATGRAFDIYMVGSRNDDARIRSWAARVQIDPAKVRNRVITLNHDGGRWLSLGMRGELPAVVKKVESQWRRE